MRSTFWPNHIFERESSQNRRTGLKFSPKRENRALSIKIVQNALFRTCAAPFGQIAVLTDQSSQNPHTGIKFSFKIGKQCAFHENCAKRSFQVMRSTFWPNHIFEPWKFSKSSHWPEILAKTGKQCAFHENCTKRSFQDMRSTFWPNRTFDRESSQNRHSGLNFSSKRENILKLVRLASNSLQNGKKVRFQWKLYKTLFSAHAQHVLAKSHFWAWKFSKSSHWPQILAKTGKQCAFHQNCTKRSFRTCAARFGQIALLTVKVLKIVTLASNSLQNRKTVRFP